MMFINRGSRGSQIPAAHRGSDRGSQQNHHRMASAPLDQGGSINPQLTVTPQALQNWLSDTQVEDTATPVPVWTATQVWAGIPVSQNEVDFKLPLETKRTIKIKPFPSPKAPKGDSPSRVSKNGALSTTRSAQKSGGSRASVIMKLGQEPPEPFRAIEESTDDIFHLPSLNPVFQPFGSTPKSHEHISRIGPLPESTGVIYPTENTLKLARNFQWKNPGLTSNLTHSRDEWSPTPVLFGESAPSPGITIVDDLEGTIASFEDVDIMGLDQNVQPQWVARPGALPPLFTGEAGDETDDEAEDLECGFGLVGIKKAVRDAFQKLSDIKIYEMKATRDGETFIHLQNAIKIDVIRVLLDWIPGIHLAALSIKPVGSPESAHKCLMYAARTINRLDALGNNYDLEDLKYDFSCRLRSENGKIVKTWKDIAGYQPYGILVWIWRDLCLSVLDGCLDEQSSGALVSRLLGDIMGCVPLDTYDFREKREILSFWDLFLTGGLLSARKGSSKKVRAPDPTYWSGSFIKVKKHLDQLYCAYRLNELRMHPSVDLYRTLKKIFPEKYRKEALETVKDKCPPSTVDAQIDIFVFEHDTLCLERLLEDGLLERGSKRFRDVLVSFSYLKKAEVEWARKQVLMGFREEVEALSNELLRVFPNVHVAFDILSEGEETEGHSERWFLEKAREGYNLMGAEDASGVTTTRAEERNVGVSNMSIGHIFAAYLSMGLRWGGGASCPARERLLGDMKAVFLSKLRILFQLKRWVGGTLKKGCKTYHACELGVGLEYLLGDFGFEGILNSEGEVRRVGAPRGRPRLQTSSKKNTTKKVSRGIAITKAKGAKRPTNISVFEDDE